MPPPDVSAQQIRNCIAAWRLASSLVKQTVESMKADKFQIDPGSSRTLDAARAAQEALAGLDANLASELGVDILEKAVDTLRTGFWRDTTARSRLVDVRDKFVYVQRRIDARLLSLEDWLGRVANGS